MTKAVKVKYVQEDEQMPPLSRAAHIAMLVLGAAGCNTWKSLVETPAAQKRVRVTAEQQKLLNDYSYVIQYIQRTPMRTINFCPICCRWSVVAKNPAVKSSGCKQTIGCTGQVVRVGKTPAKKELAE